MNARRSSLPAIAGWEYAQQAGRNRKGIVSRTRCSVLHDAPQSRGPIVPIAAEPNGPRLCSAPLTRCAVSGAREFSLNRLARIWHRRRQAAIDRDRLSVDVGGVVAGEKQSHRRQFMRLAGALERVELPDLAVG